MIFGREGRGLLRKGEVKEQKDHLSRGDRPEGKGLQHRV